MLLRSSSFSIVNRGQSLEYEQQAPQELQAPIGRRAWDLCGAILSIESPSLAERSHLEQVAETLGCAGRAAAGQAAVTCCSTLLTIMLGEVPRLNHMIDLTKPALTLTASRAAHFG